MLNLFGPPNVEKMKTRRDIDGLVKTLAYPKDPAVRLQAARALGDLGAGESAHLIAGLLITEDEFGFRKEYAGILEKLNWVPAKDRAGAWYWLVKWDLKKCVECGSAAMEPLLPYILEGNLQVREVIPALGQPALDTLGAVCDALLKQYLSLATNIAGLDFRSAGDRSTAAILANLADKLGNCAGALGGFRLPAAEVYLAKIYGGMLTGSYLAGQGGLKDLANNVPLRERIISAVPSTCGDAGWQLLLKAMANDPAATVRMAAIDRVCSAARNAPAMVRLPGVQASLREAVRDLEGQLASAGLASAQGIKYNLEKIRPLLAAD